jgi:hypothetical protein
MTRITIFKTKFHLLNPGLTALRGIAATNQDLWRMVQGRG